MTGRHTTVRMNPALMRRVKAYARAHELTMTAVMERAMIAYLAQPTSGKQPYRIEIPSSGAGGLMPGVDLDNNARLLDIMDGIDPAPVDECG